MLLRQYSLVFFASTLMIALTDGTGVAFTITPSNPSDVEFYREQSFAQVSPSQDATTVIDKSLWYGLLPRGGTFSFNTTLRLWSLTSELGFFGWNFQPAKNDLKGSFEIVTYQACNLGDACGGASTPISDIPTGIYRGVGSLFHLKYNPEPNDPQPGQGKLHWIQVVQANYGKANPGVPIISGIPFVDNSGRKSTPYYDYSGYRFAGEDFFMDRPYAGGISNARRNTYFNAQLYLVQETTPPGSNKRTVTIYNGIRWGWKNTVRRRSCPNTSVDSECPLPPPPPPPSCNPSSGGGGCSYRVVDNENEDQKLSLFDSSNLDVANISYDDSESPISVPESTSALGLLAIAAWGVVKAMKIRKDKQS
ncbi:hypothetical protein WA1_07520 [Scytonema hofmannii PCC 7110]|uniref:Uncharacterized protein n=1 Tax=Scytonema hofmannii PCC 7110 TaxID=128403 RepID=A0A139WTB5_9CYAN|nr:hypothetical protein [Scytonema hofmannii]KYC35653.1 hypothetical protein WA1_07520 [Scytonema hofmannii PCC 7110]